MEESITQKYRRKSGIRPFGFAGPEKSTKKLRKSLPSRELLFVRGTKNMKRIFNILHQTENSYYKMCFFLITNSYSRGWTLVNIFSFKITFNQFSISNSGYSLVLQFCFKKFFTPLILYLFNKKICPSLKNFSCFTF